MKLPWVSLAGPLEAALGTDLSGGSLPWSAPGSAPQPRNVRQGWPGKSLAI